MALKKLIKSWSWFCYSAHVLLILRNKNLIPLGSDTAVSNLSSPPLWTLDGHYLCGTACSHWDRWIQTLYISVCVHSHTCMYICSHCNCAGWNGSRCMLILFEGYVNVLHEECEYITPSHQQPSPSRSLSSTSTLSSLLSLPSSHFPLIRKKHSSSMKSLKAKPSSPGLESILDISESGTLRLRFRQYRGQLTCSDQLYSSTQVVRKWLHMWELTSCSTWGYNLKKRTRSVLFNRFYNLLGMYCLVSIRVTLSKPSKTVSGKEQRGNKLCII